MSDVSFEAGRIVEVGRDLSGASEIDVSGMLVGPGFVDLHVHFREPGQTWKEDTESGSLAAAAGGFTTVVTMPNTEPAIDSVEMVSAANSTAAKQDSCSVVVASAVTKGRLGQEIVDLESLYEAGVRVFSDDGDCLSDNHLASEVMSRLADLEGSVFAQHAEDMALTAGGHMHAGDVSERLGIGGLPTAAEANVVERDLDLVAHSGVRYHCQHVSAAATVDLIHQAKRSGLSVTAEVTPHHLVLDEHHLVDRDPNFKMYPPLRSSIDAEALRDGLENGVIDAVATDHAPHTADEKDVPFEDAPRGVVGLETSASVVWGVLKDAQRFFEVLAVAPAGILTQRSSSVVPGAPADLVVFDPRRSWTVDKLVSRSRNSPFLGQRMEGKVMYTIRSGVITHSEEVSHV